MGHMHRVLHAASVPTPEIRSRKNGTEHCRSFSHPHFLNKVGYDCEDGVGAPARSSSDSPCSSPGDGRTAPRAAAGRGVSCRPVCQRKVRLTRPARLLDGPQRCGRDFVRAVGPACSLQKVAASGPLRQGARAAPGALTGLPTAESGSSQFRGRGAEIEALADSVSGEDPLPGSQTGISSLRPQ